MSVLSTGVENSGFGFEALANLTTGSSNTAFGYKAGVTLDTGSGNVLVGDQADVNNFALNDTIVLGTAAMADQSGRFVVGSATHPIGPLVAPAAGSFAALQELVPGVGSIELLINGVPYLVPLFLKRNKETPVNK